MGTVWCCEKSGGREEDWEMGLPTHLLHDTCPASGGNYLGEVTLDLFLLMGLLWVRNRHQYKVWPQSNFECLVQGLVFGVLPAGVLSPSYQFNGYTSLGDKLMLVSCLCWYISSETETLVVTTLGQPASNTVPDLIVRPRTEN